MWKYLLHNLAGNILQFKSIETFLFSQRRNHLSSSCSYLLKYRNHTSQLTPALGQRLWNLPYEERHVRRTAVIIQIPISNGALVCMPCFHTSGPKRRAAGTPATSVPGMRRRIFLQNCLISEHEMSRSFRRTAKPELSCPDDRKARRRATSTTIQSKALWVNWRWKGGMCHLKGKPDTSFSLQIYTFWTY